ncbi:hypothetical protein ABIA33_002176 [Streptacidiphilus sp. MAP12-16]|uniref:hypothetical protein n=1 Tax=Streptacidiphilus sp. MAP12-16 TaxID=3156300 RepID=UPI003513D8D5
MVQRSLRPELGAGSWHRWVLAGWAFLWFLVDVPGGGYSWHYFAHGSALLFSGSGASPPGGMHLYANYPGLQIGPVAFACAQVLRAIGTGSGLFAGQVFMMAVGLLVLHILERSALLARPSLLRRPASLRFTTITAGGTFLILWASLSVHYGHLDDVLALLFAALAVRALVADTPALAGLCLGLAVDSKPWALVFLPLVLAVARSRRRHALIYAVATIALAWLPFVIADPGTLSAAQYAIVNDPSSALRALGVSTAGTPSWDRIAQLALGCTLGVLAIRRHRWPAVLLLGIGARLVLDPGVYDYYTAGILLGTLCWELIGLRHPVPAWSLVSFTALYLAPRMTDNAPLLGDLRLWLVLLLTAAVLLIPQSWCAEPELLASEPVQPPDPSVADGSVHRLPTRLREMSVGSAK